MHILIFGAGFSGGVLARALADGGAKVEIYERNTHLGGNAYDYFDGDILVHKYGPHIFHTNIKEVFDFLSRFTEWTPYEHRVLGCIDGKYVPIPFNLKSLAELFDSNAATHIKDILLREYGEGNKVPIFMLKQHPDKVIAEFGEFVYQKVFYNYTQKQWGFPPEMLPKGVTERVPVYISYDDRYFVDKFQFMPTKGYTEIFKSMLTHKNIKLNLGCDCKIDFFDGKISVDNAPLVEEDIVVFTGCIDELLQNKYGELPYRSLNFELEKHGKRSYQQAAVVNYPNTESYTRISEFTKFTCRETDSTVIVKEYPINHVQGETIPYYPIEREENKEIYKRYQEFFLKYPNFMTLGRLAEYRYINMDIAAANALKLAEDILKKYTFFGQLKSTH